MPFAGLEQRWPASTVEQPVQVDRQTELPQFILDRAELAYGEDDLAAIAADDAAINKCLRPAH